MKSWTKLVITQLNIISRELKAPTHDYGAKDSVWELYNYTTFAMKETHPSNWMSNHIKAHQFFTDFSNNITVREEQMTAEFHQLEMF